MTDHDKQTPDLSLKDLEGGSHPPHPQPLEQVAHEPQMPLEKIATGHLETLDTSDEGSACMAPLNKEFNILSSQGRLNIM